MKRQIVIDGGRDPARYSRLALLVVVVGVLITAVDTTIVVLALPEIQRSLHVGLASVIWVIIGYLLVITVLSTRLGAWGTCSVGSGCTRPGL